MGIRKISENANCAPKVHALQYGVFFGKGGPVNFPLLSTIIFLPLIGALAILFVPKDHKGIIQKIEIGIPLKIGRAHV